MKRKQNQETFGEALNQMLDLYKLRAPLNESRIASVWEEIMGRTISTYTSSIRIRKNILYIHIQSAPLKRDLSFGKEQIILRVNEALGDKFIKDVVIT